MTFSTIRQNGKNFSLFARISCPQNGVSYELSCNVIGSEFAPIIFWMLGHQLCFQLKLISSIKLNHKPKAMDARVVIAYPRLKLSVVGWCWHEHMESKCPWPKGMENINPVPNNVFSMDFKICPRVVHVHDHGYLRDSNIILN